MNSLDIFLLILINVIAVSIIIIPSRIHQILKILVVIVTLLFLVQFLIQGFYWQYIPSYLLLVLLAIKAFIIKVSINKYKKIMSFFFILFLSFLSILPWSIFLPVPELPTSFGVYKVGTKIFRWVDENREEQITLDTTDKRNVLVQAWYPTEQNVNGGTSSYIDGLNNLPEKIGAVPKYIFYHYNEINTQAYLNAPISKNQKHWPVIIFLTGNVSSRAFYTTLLKDLASRGYVVLAIDHPYEAMIAELADGKIATTIENYLKEEPNLLKFMKRRLDLRVADVKFVLDQLDKKINTGEYFFSSLNKNSVVIAGHSLGGATAVVAMSLDERIQAAVNIDGTLYGDLPKTNNKKPFLLIESKKDTSNRFLRYEEGNKKIFKHFSDGFRYEISEADHYSFTDVPFLLGKPVRFITSNFLAFGNIPKKTNKVTVDILNSFFSGVLKNNTTNLDSVASSYNGIIKKSIF